MWESGNDLVNHRCTATSPRYPHFPICPDKVVVRRLPHAMKEEEFIAVLTAAATEAGMGERSGSWDLLYFAPGKMSKKRGKVKIIDIHSTQHLHIYVFFYRLRSTCFCDVIW